MQKAMIAARKPDGDRLLDALRELGVLHVAPVDAAEAGPLPALAAELDRVGRAIQVLEQIRQQKEAAPSSRSEPADRPANQIIDRVLFIQRHSAELTGRLNNLRRQLEQLAMWGDVRLEQFEQLKAAGIDIQFAVVDRDQLAMVRGELVEVLLSMPGKRVMVAAVNPAAELAWPDDAVPMPLPGRDRPSIRAEAGEIDAELKAISQELQCLALYLPLLRRERSRVQQDADFSAARRSGWKDPDLFVLQGWVPADAAGRLAIDLAERNVQAAVQIVELVDGEHPPTLLREPRWATPIMGLFKILGLTPGYRELDVAVPFFVALPIFAAMLMADGGYALLFMLVPLIMWRRVSGLFGPRFTQLLIVIGAAGVAWGVITGAFFGLGPEQVGFLGRFQILRVDLDQDAFRLMMRISFTIGVIHLSLAQLWRAAVLFPDISFLSRVGWAMFLWGMYAVVGMLILGGPPVWETPMIYLLLVGGVLAIVFARPHRNPAVMLGMGLANFPLSAVGTFSDIMSYVRLMAVGMASTVLASTFNELAMSGPRVAAPLILVLGHGLNIGLFMIALFAHGVRLNVLEFSNNLGMEWNGYAYSPFSARQTQES